MSGRAGMGDLGFVCVVSNTCILPYVTWLLVSLLNMIHVPYVGASCLGSMLVLDSLFCCMV